ncbi:GNAT family N-acetyltransferase [Thiomicrorhabdus sp.]|uniref:GNAT family N-acetyltransferase n=1 Tax=Thiomicrorhabdus sp. TaxID=2039724 RepID=UPI002AA5E408|nr:GNAT family N-acetyltransferase [Thiomicrorhabdus sp.]
MKIRPAECKDIPDMIQLLKVLFEIEVDFEFSPEKHHAGLSAVIQDQNCGAFVALSDNEKLVGMCTAQWVISTATGQKSAWMEDLIVANKYRGNGVGHQLIEAIQRWAIEQGCNRIQLVYDLANQPAIEFYEKRNFNHTKLGVFTKPL